MVAKEDNAPRLRRRVHIASEIIRVAHGTLAQQLVVRSRKLRDDVEVQLQRQIVERRWVGNRCLEWLHISSEQQ